MLKEKNLDNYIKCLKNKIKEYKSIELNVCNRQNKGTKYKISLEAVNYYSTIYRLMVYKTVLKDLEEIITRINEMEREGDESSGSVWKSWDDIK